MADLAPSLPTDHPASIQFLAWLNAFNTGDIDKLTAYYNNSILPHAVASKNRRDMRSLQGELFLEQAGGSFSIVDIEDISSPASAVIVLKREKRPIHIRVCISVNILEAHYPVTEFKINAITTPLKFMPEDDPRRPQYEKALKPLDAILRRKLVDAAMKVLREDYVDPELGEKIANDLNAHCKSGHYDGFEDSTKFAQRLTEDMYETGHVEKCFIPAVVQDSNIISVKALQLTGFSDGQMIIRFIEPRYLKAHKDKDDKKPDIRGRIEEAERADHSFGTITFDSDSVPGKTIATLPINSFVQSIEKRWGPWKEVRAVIGQKLSSIANADALIIDLRQNHGGQPETIGFMLSYLLDDGPCHVLDFVDRQGTIGKSISTLGIDELPISTKPFGGTKPLFVLTADNTISGGEDMAYTLQAFKRAIATIGEGNEQTKGAANHITRPHHLCEEKVGEHWWVASIPNLKPVHPVTGTNWEGFGVKSDIVAGKGEWEEIEDAKDVATCLAIKILRQGKDEM